MSPEERRGRGQPPKYGAAMTERIHLQLTEAERAEIEAAVPDGAPVGRWIVDAALMRSRGVGVDGIQWIVNDLGELGVKVGDTFAFMYKGRSLLDGSKWRPIGKREFGETAHPFAWWTHCGIGSCGSPNPPDRGGPNPDGTYTLGDGWLPLPESDDE